jgi:hypothetical protein
MEEIEYVKERINSALRHIDTWIKICEKDPNPNEEDKTYKAELIEDKDKLEQCLEILE